MNFALSPPRGSAKRFLGLGESLLTGLPVVKTQPVGGI
jgi:hypothetical protein